MSTKQNYSPLPVAEFDAFISWALEQGLAYTRPGLYTFRLCTPHFDIDRLETYVFNMSQNREYWIGKNDQAKKFIAQYKPQTKAIATSIQPKGPVHHAFYSSDLAKFSNYLQQNGYEFLRETSYKLEYVCRATRKKLLFSFCQRDYRRCVITSSPSGNKLIKEFINKCSVQVPTAKPDVRRAPKADKPLDISLCVFPDTLPSFKAFMASQGFTFVTNEKKDVRFYRTKDPVEPGLLKYDSTRQVYIPANYAATYLRFFNAQTAPMAKLDSLASAHS
jgi:hypothetical protein